MDKVEDLLRRLALNDEGAVAAALADHGEWGLDPKSHALVRLGALVALGAAPTSYRLSVERAHAAGSTDEEVLSVLGAVGAAVGFARVVAAAPDLALAIGYDVEAALDTGPNGQ